MKIIIIQNGPDYEVFPLMSLLIGMNKKYPKIHTTWVGMPETANLVRFNKRVNSFIDIYKEFTLDLLQKTFGSDICVNLSLDRLARQFASQVSAKTIVGFDKKGATSREAEFVEKIFRHKIKTNKTILQIYYDIAGLRWQGEGYGLSYYPKTKQQYECGSYVIGDYDGNCPEISLSEIPSKQIDILNQYAEIVTDDLFVAHAGIALRKKISFLSESLPYKLEFFGKGSMKPRGQSS